VWRLCILVTPSICGGDVIALVNVESRRFKKVKGKVVPVLN
jgi:hypothetical protein